MREGESELFADLTEVILRVARELTHREHRDKGSISLTPANGNIMRYIDRNPGTTPSEVADATGVFRSNLSASLRELEKIGFVERRADPADGRGVRLYSTDSAARNLAEIRKVWRESAQIAAEGLDGIHEAISLLEMMAARLVSERRNSHKE